MTLNQILSTILKTNVWRSVWRICMWILGLKGLTAQATGSLQALHQININKNPNKTM